MVDVYYTWGSGQHSLAGEDLLGDYARVRACSYKRCYELFREYNMRLTGKPDRYAFSYTADHWAEMKIKHQQLVVLYGFPELNLRIFINDTAGNAR